MTWDEVAARLAPARSYWVASIGAGGAPHTVPVWGVELEGTLYFYGERTTVRVAHLARDGRVAVHLEDPSDVLVVNGRLEDVGTTTDHPAVVAALRAKYDEPGDAGYLPSDTTPFDLVYRFVPDRAMSWNLEDFEGSQRRWRAPRTRS